MRVLKIMMILTITLLGCEQKNDRLYLASAKQISCLIDRYYQIRSDSLYVETYPYKKDLNVTYLADNNNNDKKEKAAYLWPLSGLLSSHVALYKAKHDQSILYKIKKQIIPVMDKYYNPDKTYPCYMSYLKEEGFSDSFYDDNIWIAIDYCDLYKATNNRYFLCRAEKLWRFIISGWDENLNGGIYWYERRRKTKNTCSNAPACVLACKLYQATNRTDYLNKAIDIYNWTQSNLQDSSDNLYWDNVDLQGKVDTRKYAYNSGQMIQSGALLYQITGEKRYLNDAHVIASSAMDHFTREKQIEDKKIKIFEGDNNWFIAVLIRGYCELYMIDKNYQYIDIIKRNCDWLLKMRRDDNGLFEKDWYHEEIRESHKWLMDQASIMEIFARIYEINKQ